MKHRIPKDAPFLQPGYRFSLDPAWPPGFVSQLAPEPAKNIEKANDVVRRRRIAGERIAGHSAGNQTALARVKELA